MAGSYTLPQVRVFQEFAETPNDVTQNLNPFVIGPSYQLLRYSEEDERTDCRHSEYKGTSGVSLAWADGASGTVVDKGWYSATLADAYAKFGDLSKPSCIDASSGLGTKFEFTIAEGKSLSNEGAGLYFDTAVKTGDYLGYKVNAGDDWSFSRIRAITSGKIEPGKISSTVTNKSSGQKYTGISVNLTNYVGETAGTINLTVDDAGKATCTSTIPGVDLSTPTTIPASGATCNLGAGITITKAGESVAKGVYVITIAISEPHSRDTVTVVDLIPSTLNTATVFRKFDSIDVDSSFVEKTSGDVGITIAPDVTVKYEGHTFTVVKAEAYLNQRNYRTDHTDGVYTVTDDTDIVTNIGKITPDNPLAYGAHIMLLNCATARIRYIAVESNNRAGFTKALERASVTTEVYAFCPLTEDRTIIDDVVADCERMSSEEEKSWRISFFSMPTDRVVDITPFKLNEALTPIYEQCTVETTGTGEAAVTTLTCRPNGGTTSQVSSIAQFTTTVATNDTVTVYVDGVGTPCKVKRATSDVTLVLDTNVTGAAASLCDFKIDHTRGQAEYVAAIAATSTHFHNRRAYNVFPSTLKDTDGNYVKGMYGAAAVCALACSVAPQQPITNVELNGFSDVSDVYSKFSRAELNEIAAGGTLIIMQDTAGGTIYVRHQISTAYSSGNLNKTELSMTKNLDSISYYFANRFAPYTGRYNITPDLINELKGVLSDGLAHLETTTETSKLVGPQLIADGTEIRSLYQDPNQKDKVYANVALNLPAPFNNFDLHLQVI